ncbi:MAG: hypothetical protein M5U26_16855 [Planctomycetota bacterium]|nr:hypothetical protein [Planctomycetota bacterium]
MAQYVPNSDDAQFDQYAGQEFEDPLAYASAQPKRIDAKFFLKPVQDELLRLIELALEGLAALPVRNGTGSLLEKGALVRVAGFDSGASRWLVEPADANDASRPAQFVLDEALADEAEGVAYAHRTVSGLDTSGTAPNDPVYLSAEEGVYGFAPPEGAARAQEVGRVAAVGAEGAIWFSVGGLAAGRAPGGTGTPGALARWSGAGELGDAAVSDDGSDLTLAPSGTVYAAAALVPDSGNARDLGSAEAAWRGAYLGEDTGSGAHFGADADWRWYYDEAGLDALMLAESDVPALALKGSDPGNFNAVSDTNGNDLYFKTQGGGAHAGGNPRGGRLIFVTGAAGSGGSGAEGDVRFRRSDGSYELRIETRNSLGRGGFDVTTGSLLDFRVNGTICLSISSGGFQVASSKEFSFGTISNAVLRHAAIGSDAATYEFQVIGQNAFAAASTNRNGGNVVVTPGAHATSGGAAGRLVVRDPHGSAGVDEVHVQHDGTDARIEPKSGELRVAGSGLRVENGCALDAQTPAALDSDANDYDPGARTFTRLSASAARNVTGLAGGSDGRQLWVANAGNFAIVFKHEAAGSAAANRLIGIGGTDVTLAANETAILIYDGTTQRWRFMART